MFDEDQVLKSRLHQTLAAGGLVLREWSLAPERVELTGGIGAVAGLRAGELPGGWKAWLAFVHPDDIGLVNEVIHKSLSSGGHYGFEYRLCGEAKPVWVREQGVVFPDARHAPASVLSLVREISEIQDLENRLGHARKMEAFGKLAGGVAHDFNNMLGIILGYAQLILHDVAANDPQLPFLREIENAARRASSLTNQLLAFTRQEVQGTRVLQMDDILNEMGKMLGRLIGEQLRLVLDPGAGGAGKVRVDRNQIEQLLIHLAICARDLLPEGGIFTLHTRLTEAGSEASSGAAAPQFLLAAECHALSPTDRENPSPGPLVPWSENLDALETCASIVTENNGSLSVGGDPNLPGALAIFFPLALKMPPPTDPAIPGGPLVSRAAGKPGTVLWVEDDKGLRNLGSVVLARMGYRVLEAENGVAGLRAFDSSAPGEIVLVVTDIVMPAMGGKEMAGKICALVPSLPVLFISGYPEQFQQILQDRPPATHAFLRKPFPMGELTAKVRELVGH